MISFIDLDSESKMEVDDGAGKEFKHYGQENIESCSDGTVIEEGCTLVLS